MTEPPSRLIGPFKVGEKPAPLVYTFQDENGAAINLTGYTVKFNYREREISSASVGNGALVSGGTTGQVQYVWTGNEFPTPGHYLAEFWVGNGTQRWASLTIKFDVSAPIGAVPSI